MESNQIAYTLVAILLSTAIYEIRLRLLSQPLRFRERMLKGIALPSPPVGKFISRPLRLTPLRGGWFAALALVPVDTLLRSNLSGWTPVFLAVEFALFAAIIKKLDRNEPVVESIEISEGEMKVTFQNRCKLPARVFRLSELEFYGNFVSGQYYGHGERRPARGIDLGIGVFDQNDNLLFLIPTYIMGYRQLKNWLVSSLPLRGEPSWRLQ